jgi:hypothetical protein
MYIPILISIFVVLYLVALCRYWRRDLQEIKRAKEISAEQKEIEDKRRKATQKAMNKAVSVGAVKGTLVRTGKTVTVTAGITYPGITPYVTAYPSYPQGMPGYTAGELNEVSEEEAPPIKKDEKDPFMKYLNDKLEKYQ